MSKHANFYSKAQAMLEYLLVMVVVVVIVFLGFKNSGGGLLNKTHSQVNQYFDTGSKAIMGGYFDATTNTFVQVEPNPINGDWCAWTTCIKGYRTRECACPRPAFGGNACVADSQGRESIWSDDCPSSSVGGGEEECNRYRCHLLGGEELVGTCACPEEPESCVAGEESIVCHP